MAQTYFPARWESFPAGPDFYEFWEDFDDEYALSSNLPVATSSPWVGTALNTGTFAQTTDEKFGVAVFSGAGTTDNSGAQIQGDMEDVSLVTSKTTRFLVRFKLSDSTQSEFFAGLGITDTTFLDGTGTLAAGLTHTDSVGFYKPDGEQNVYLVVRRDSVNVAAQSVTAISDATYVVLGFEVAMSSTAGTGTVRVSVDGNWVASAGTFSTVMPYDTEEVLTPTISFLSGDATGTKTATVDYIGVLQER